MRMFYKLEIYIIVLIWKGVMILWNYFTFSVHDSNNNKRIKIGVFTNHMANEWDSDVLSVQFPYD